MTVDDDMRAAMESADDAGVLLVRVALAQADPGPREALLALALDAQELADRIQTVREALALAERARDLLPLG